MRKQPIFALATALLIVLLAISIFNTAAPISAKSILDQAYQAQTQTVPTQGIWHTRYSTYFDEHALPGNQGVGVVNERYEDLQTCDSRSVTSEAKTGKVIDVFARVGSWVYGPGTPNYAVDLTLGPLTVYHSPDDGTEVPCAQPTPVTMNDDDKAKFDQMRADANVTLVGQDTWSGGRTVYILRSPEQVRLLTQDNQAKLVDGTLTLYFDVKTYVLAGADESIMGSDGQPLLISSKRTVIDEILPSGTKIAWDLSDVQGINIVEDPTGAHRDTGARG
ncbi:MAG TPA: hypothetical protein VHD90_03820 [Phototrophicaceae bacterium]|nr:hypothetical protein [Phototrophicaceae bacterium]